MKLLGRVVLYYERGAHGRSRDVSKPQTVCRVGLDQCLLHRVNYGDELRSSKTGIRQEKSATNRSYEGRISDGSSFSSIWVKLALAVVGLTVRYPGGR